MKTKLTTTVVAAVVLLASAASVVAGQPNGRDSVYAQPGKAVTSHATTGVNNFGRDSVHVTKDTRLTKPDTAKVTTVAPKAGRA